MKSKDEWWRSIWRLLRQNCDLLEDKFGEYLGEPPGRGSGYNGA